MTRENQPQNEPTLGESARIAELHACEILDTPAEQEFDDLTELAALICGVPIALISLVDVERQWFKSKIGLETAETPRSMAFCSHALGSSDVMVVPDALQDERFNTNPLVLQEPKIRFYAGAPLITKSRHALGTLCVIDRVPRELTAEQSKALGILSRQVVSLLERKQAERALQQARAEQEQQVSELEASAVREMRVQSLLQHETRLREEAEHLNRVKDEFLGVLSHELRTPLNAILGWAELIRRRELSPQQLKAGCEAIARSARAQARIVDDLLDMNRISAGKLQLKRQRVDVREILNAALETVLPAAQEKGVAIEIKASDGRSPEVYGDTTRLQQIFWNVLSNAVRFNSQGGRVRVSLESSENEVVFSCEDTGIGISPQFLPYVFERFRQADASVSRRYGGLGLGLSIVKALTALHGGQVSASSEGEGSGARFEVRLPSAEADAVYTPTEVVPTDTEEAHGLPPRVLDGCKILVVDDERDCLSLVRTILEEEGANVKIAQSSAEGLEVLSDFAPDVIVSDIGMPGGDGYEFLERVRAGRAAHGATAPAIALTAFARNQERERSLQAGFQIHMSKPFDAPKLVRMVYSLACQEARGEIPAVEKHP
jgi:signal transduction histidine kinase/ActR/RegA family two-component response regulator